MGVPELRDVVQVVGRHPHALLGHGTMVTKVGFELVEEEQWVGKRGKSHFLGCGGRSRSRVASERQSSLSADETGLSFKAARSTLTAVISVVTVFKDSRRSARVGSLMADG